MSRMLRGLTIFLAIFIGLAAAVAVYLYLEDEDDERSTYVEQHDDAGPGINGLVVLPDDGRESILAEIDAATSSILLEIYLLSDNETINALVRAHNRGLDVRVLLEEHPFGGAGNQEEVFNRLAAAGIDVRWNNPVFRFSHIKTIILDQRVAIIMNLNLTMTAFTGNREFAIVTTQPGPVAQAIAIFESDWTRADEPPDGPLVVSPTTSRDDLLGLIRNATDELSLYAEVITDLEVTEELIAAADRGVRVRLIMSESSADDLWEERPGDLARGGVEVVILNRLYIHAKMILVDDRAAYVGSQNFTSTSLDQNRELGMIVTDRPIISRLSQVFELDFAEGVALQEPR